MKNSNEDVPPEAVIRNLIEENNRLRHEKSELKHQLDCKLEAIKHFKEWQKSVASYNYHYWLNEGLKIAEFTPDKEELETLRRVIGNFTTYKRWLKKLTDAARNLDVSSKKLKKIVS